MPWTDNLTTNGLTGPVPASQITPLQYSNLYSQGSTPANNVSGTFTNTLTVGNAANSNNAVYIDPQGIYAGNSVFSKAPFSVDLQGNVRASTIVLTGYIPVGGAAADVNSNVTTIDGSQITTGTVTANKINVANLSAISADLGSITAGTITGNTITGNTIVGGTITGTTITGGVLQTGTSGQRVTINESGNNAITFYDSSSVATTVYGAGGSLFIAGTLGVQVDISAGGKVLAGDEIFTAANIIASTGLGVLAGGFTVTGNSSVNGDFIAFGGTKSFDIEHPDGTPNKRLRYIDIESHEVVVTSRGTGAAPAPPQNFLDVCEPGSIQYIIGDDGSGGKNWFATGIRKGYADYDPEYFKANG